MADIHIRRDHALGLACARAVASTWVQEVEGRFDMRCATAVGHAADTVDFRRTGVSGTLTVAGDHFDLRVKLGFLLGAFSATIETEISNNLDALLIRAGAPAATPPSTTSQDATGNLPQVEPKNAPRNAPKNAPGLATRTPAKKKPGR